MAVCNEKQMMSFVTEIGQEHWFSYSSMGPTSSGILLLLYSLYVQKILIHVRNCLNQLFSSNFRATT